jgi:hypothetical protein
LILHPFGGESSSSVLLEGSRASLALQGLIATGLDDDELLRRLMAGRYQEVRMLICIGKDLLRWIGQCMDCVGRAGALNPALSEQSFASIVVESPPEPVRHKLENWGVTDRRGVFARAIALNSIFEEPPPPDCLAPGFLNSYHRYADFAWMCFQQLRPFHEVDPAGFTFEIFASDEYAQKLESEWSAGPSA